MDYSLFTALVLGLFSTVHCVGMCGSIMGTLAFSLPAHVRENPRTFSRYLAAYNVGRITSYALGGAVIGLLSSATYTFLSPRGGYLVLQTLAAVLLVAVGLYVGGWFPRFAVVEKIGVPLWRKLEPLGRRMIPVRSPWQAFGYGLVWGWLPCGLVYTALLFTVTAGSPVQGALFMTVFGLGTLPAVMGAGILSDRLRRASRMPRVRQVAGAVLIVFGLAGVVFSDWLHGTAPLPQDHETLECRDDRV